MNWSAEEVVEVPAVVVAVMLTIPEPAGESTEHDVVVAQATCVPAVLPKEMVVPPVTKFVPVTVTVVPPPAGPDAGETAVTVGSVDPLEAAATVTVVFAVAGVVPELPEAVTVRS